MAFFQNALAGPMTSSMYGPQTTAQPGITSMPSITAGSPSGMQQQAGDMALLNLKDTLSPYVDAGHGAIGNLSNMASGNFDFNTIKDNPMYQFAFDEASRGANRRLSSMGLADSTYGARTLGRVGGDVAMNALNDIYNRNLGIAGLGQNAATNYAGSYGDIITGLANARASNVLSQNALNAQSDADWMNLIGGLGGTYLGNMGEINAGLGNAWDAISGWFS